MDLVSSIRKSGSRGGVNFSWDDVAGSQHRENYLGHSLKAPVGRWQKGRDLTWYAKSDDQAVAANGADAETPEERAARERKEEIRKIKEAEEEAIARALGLPIAPKNATGANAVGVSGARGAPAETDVPALESKVKGDAGRRDDSRRGRRHDDSERRHRRRHRSRSHSRDRRRPRSPRRRDAEDKDHDAGHSHGHRQREDKHHRRRREYDDVRDDGRHRRHQQRSGRSRSPERDGNGNRDEDRRDGRANRRLLSASRDGRRRSASPSHHRRHGSPFYDRR